MGRAVTPLRRQALLVAGYWIPSEWTVPLRPSADLFGFGPDSADATASFLGPVLAPACLACRGSYVWRGWGASLRVLSTWVHRLTSARVGLTGSHGPACRNVSHKNLHRILEFKTGDWVWIFRPESILYPGSLAAILLDWSL